MDTGQISRFVQSHYGLSGEFERLAGENENYCLRTDDGGRFVLKICGGVGPAATELENEAVETLAAALPDLRLPTSVPSSTGSPVVSCSEGKEARLLEFVEGTPWLEAGEPSAERCRALGSTLAQVALGLADLNSEAADRSHRWDLAAAALHRRHVGWIEDLDRRRVVDQAFQTFAAAWSSLGEFLPRGVIHGDANDENVLVEGDRIVGLLDFGDCLENPLICELAIALAYVMQRTAEPWKVAAHVVEGYHTLRPLQESEREALFPLILGRLAVTLTTCSERRRIDATRESWFASEEPAWKLLSRLGSHSPRDAAHALTSGIQEAGTDQQGSEPELLLEKRRQLMNPAMSVSYRDPLKIVRGRGQFLIDHHGRPFLDLVNNVCHVGHCHPRVVEAGQRQIAELNTNTRYLHDGLTDYAARLCATLPSSLDTCFFVNSGSEANELALRLARQHTGREHIMVLEGAYHGHTSSLIAMSPYKFRGKGGKGVAESWVHVVPSPDGYRGEHKGHGAESGRAYAEDVRRTISEASEPIAGFLCESILSCGGQVEPPEGYFAAAFEHVRKAGGVCIVDEVQVGFARVGSHFWAFERQGVTPDIVVMGKPIGNGHPMAAVITTKQIANSFANGMEFFATFGGNPVSCAIGNAVLDVIEAEQLQEHARILGEFFLTELQGLAQRHSLIGHVRGAGLFLGVELVRDPDTLEPASEEADEVINRLRHRGILLSTDGPLANVLKIKPPMVLTQDDVEFAIRALDETLASLQS